MADCIGLIFSKDRALQLDAVLQSLQVHCTDSQELCLRVIYTVSSQLHQTHYEELKTNYPQVEFIRETAFKPQVDTSVAAYEYVLFLVDDNIFVRDFSLKAILESLQDNNDALGFSLRLGTNISFCYPLQQPQACPAFIPVTQDFLKFSWLTGKCDFGYPLEVSSSVYRVSDIYEILRQTNYFNPSTLEIALANNRALFLNKKNMLLCNKDTITFCNPVNIVQSTCKNLAGITFNYTVEQLAQLFAAGYRIDVAKYSGFTPAACHEEVELLLVKRVVKRGRFST